MVLYQINTHFKLTKVQCYENYSMKSHCMSNHHSRSYSKLYRGLWTRHGGKCLYPLSEGRGDGHSLNSYVIFRDPRPRDPSEEV